MLQGELHTGATMFSTTATCSNQLSLLPHSSVVVYTGECVRCTPSNTYSNINWGNDTKGEFDRFPMRFS